MVLRLWISTTRRWISYEEKANRRAWAVPSADKVWYTVDFIYATTRSAMHWYASLDIQDIAFKSNLESALMNNGRWEVRRRGVRMKCRPWSLCGRLSPANLVSTPTRCLPFLIGCFGFFLFTTTVTFMCLVNPINKRFIQASVWMSPSILIAIKLCLQGKHSQELCITWSWSSSRYRYLWGR
jgi:hypothetical protein